MRKILVALLCIFSLQNISGQFRYDNKLYKTIFWDDLCKALQQQKDYLLLDVRSPGEYADTSEIVSMNIGRLKGAMNLDIKQLPDSIEKLEAFKNKTIYVYCSHSQRSRRVSKMLSEKGFTNVININGGMTMLNLLKDPAIPCAQSILESSNRYKLLSPREMCAAAADGKNTFLLDVRSDSAFKGISKEESQNAFGRFRNSVNIPISKIAASLDQIPKDKKIILIDDFGDQSAKAASILFANGYSELSVLFNGLGEWVSTDASELPCKDELTERKSSFGILTPEGLSKIMHDKNTLILDIRPDSDYQNIAPEHWRNIGKIKNAINIPAAELGQRLHELSAYKSRSIVLYSLFSPPELFSCAKLLADNHFSKVSILAGGIFDIRWEAANIKDHEYLNELVTNIPPDNY